MGKYDEQPVYWLTKWIETRLRQQGLIPPVEKYQLDMSDTDGLDFQVPFFSPSQQSPETNTVFDDDAFSNVPFAIYTLSHWFDNEMPYLKVGELGFVVYYNDTDSLFSIANYIIDLAGRSNWSADDINSFYATTPECPFEFKSLIIDSAAGPMETDDEGGRYAYMVTVRYDAVYEGFNRPPESAPAYSHRNVGKL